MAGQRYTFVSNAFGWLTYHLYFFLQAWMAVDGRALAMRWSAQVPQERLECTLEPEQTGTEWATKVPGKRLGRTCLAFAIRCLRTSSEWPDLGRSFRRA